jgi:hypothetical protein
VSDNAGEWLRSSFCSDGHCIEVSLQDGDVLMRDSKQQEQQPLRFSRADWGAFVGAVSAGKLQVFRPER